MVPERGGLFPGAKSTLLETCIRAWERLKAWEALHVVSTKFAQCSVAQSLIKPALDKGSVERLKHGYESMKLGLAIARKLCTQKVPVQPYLLRSKTIYRHLYLPR